MKKYLFVMRHLPHCSSRVQETLDQILTTAAFDQKVSLLFVDDGVLQLKSGQNPNRINLRNTCAVFQALQIYDINDLYVESESLSARSLLQSDLILPVQCIQRSALNALVQQHDVILAD